MLLACKVLVWIFQHAHGPYAHDPWADQCQRDRSLDEGQEMGNHIITPGTSNLDSLPNQLFDGGDCDSISARY